MKLLIIIIIIRFLFALLDQAGKNKKEETRPDRQTDERHPAEFQLR